MKIPIEIKKYWIHMGYTVHDSSDYVFLRRQNNIKQKFYGAYWWNGRIRYWFNVGEIPPIFLLEEEFLRILRLKAFL